MKRHARKAYTALNDLNVHLIDHGDACRSDNAHFLIGCEYRTMDDQLVGDFYLEEIKEYVDEDGVIHNAFGIRTVVHDILSRNGLFAEWINGHLLGVYDI